MKSTRPLQPGGNCLARTVFLLALVVALIAAPPIHAQAVSFVSAQTTILDSGLNFPTGVAVDGTGNVFIADNDNRVLKVSPTGVQSTVASGLKIPYGVAVDSTGNVFIADAYNNRVLKVSPNGDQSTVGTGLSNPRGVAVDGAGTVYIADAYNDRVLKVFRSGSQAVVAAGLNLPAGVAVDAAGNVFIADTGNNRVVKVPLNGAQTTVTPYLAEPYGVAVDGAGNVFIADSNNHRVVKVSPDGTQKTVGGGFFGPYGVAVDAAGSLFIADSGHNRVLELQLTAVHFGALNICPLGQASPAPCSRTLTLNYHIDTGGKLGTPAVLTQGASNADFKLAGSNCAGDVSTGASCSVTATFAPMAPGARLGGVEVVDSNSKVLTTTLIYGKGQGAAVAFGPGAQTTLASGLYAPSGVAVDGAGNVYIADFAKHRVLKVSPGGAQTEVGTGLRFPSAVAVGGAGNVLIADTGNNRVVKVRTHGGEQTTIADGLNLPQGVALDGAGNVFIADYGNNRVLKIAAASGAQTTLGFGLKLPYGVAVDGTGNVYIADYGNDRVVKVSPGGAQSPVADGLNFPTAVAVDASGTVFIGDTLNDRVLVVPPIGVPPTTVATGLAHPQGVAVDAVGNIFIADSRNNRVVEVQRSVAPALNFTTTVVGRTNGPQTVTIWNIGNQRFETVAPGLTIGANYQLGGGGTAPADCSAKLGMGPGASCDLNIYFAPQTAGVLTGTVVMTDNAMNADPATQMINVTGTALVATTTSVPAAAGQYSDAVTLTATIGPSGLTFDGSLRFVAGGVAACSVAVKGSGTYNCSYVTTQVAQNATIRVELTSSDASVQGSVGFGTLTISPEDATIVPSSSNPVTIQANSTGESGPFSLTGTVKQASDGSLGDLGAADSFSVTLVPSTGPTIACPAGADGAGHLSAICRLVPVGSYTVRWSTTDRYFKAPTVTTSLSVTR